MKAKQLIAKHLKERKGDSIPPPPAALDQLVEILEFNTTAAGGTKIDTKQALRAMQAAGATAVHSTARVNDICRKYLGRKGGFWAP